MTDVKHTFVCGATRSGKSEAELVRLVALAKVNDIAIVLLDPPGTLAKNAVFASTPEARLRTQPLRTPRKMATSAAATSSHQCALTSSPTIGVK